MNDSLVLARRVQVGFMQHAELLFPGEVVHLVSHLTAVAAGHMWALYNQNNPNL